jgi:hypothetical protein
VYKLDLIKKFTSYFTHFTHLQNGTNHQSLGIHQILNIKSLSKLNIEKYHRINLNFLEF